MQHPLAVDFDPTSDPFGLSKRATGADALTDEEDGALWQGNISVGTPLQPYTVDFDTGSSDLFLPGSTCQTNCKGHKIYNPASSSTAADRHKTFSLRYGDGSQVAGEQYSDTVTIAGLTVSWFLYPSPSSVSSNRNCRRNSKHLVQPLPIPLVSLCPTSPRTVSSEWDTSRSRTIIPLPYFRRSLHRAKQRNPCSPLSLRRRDPNSISEESIRNCIPVPLRMHR